MKMDKENEYLNKLDVKIHQRFPKAILIQNEVGFKRVNLDYTIKGEFGTLELSVLPLKAFETCSILPQIIIEEESQKKYTLDFLLENTQHLRFELERLGFKKPTRFQAKNENLVVNFQPKKVDYLFLDNLLEQIYYEYSTYLN